jgi:hypothetical protein
MKKMTNKWAAYGCSVVSMLTACGGTLELGGSGGGSAGAPLTAGQPGTGGANAGTSGTGANGGVAGGTAGHGGRVGTTAGSGPDVAGAGSGGAAGSPTDGDAGKPSTADGGAAGEEPAPECDCASTDALMVLDCGAERVYGGPKGTYLSEDGSVVLFAPGNGSVGTLVGRWSAEDGTKFSDGYPLGLSDDGTIGLVSGESSSYLLNADLSRTELPVSAQRLSADGLTVLGVRDTSAGGREWIRWTEAGGVVPVGLDADLHLIQAISDDASVLGGSYQEQTPGGVVTRPFIWGTAGMVLIVVDPSDGSAADGSTFALSPDGTRLAGSLRDAGESYAVFVYSEADGAQQLGGCYAPFLACSANEVYPVFSADNATLAATLGDPDASNPVAIRHTEAGGSMALDTQRATQVRGMSRDGTRIFGVVSSGSGDAAPLVWDEHGERGLEDALRTDGADLRGWELKSGFAISKDGKVAVGQGTCGGKAALYRAVIPD